MSNKMDKKIRKQINKKLEHYEIALKPKPKFMPGFVYSYLVKLLLEVKYI